jgi:hypothetical protein
MAGPNRFTEFLRDPDQAARRAELSAFIGPNPEPFLKAYDAMREAVLRVPGQRRRFGLRGGFVWLAFLLGPCWFFYRKLWIWAAAITAMMIGFAFLPRFFSAGIAVGLAVAGRSAYLQHAIARITVLRGTEPVADLDALARAGGAAPLAGWISGAVLVVLILVSIAATAIAVSAPV